ncbi:MAG: GNAT family N-acetyltransferase, partial [Bacteroidota bacterium]
PFMIHLHLAKETDLTHIAKMAKEIWNVHYVSMVGQEQVDYMLRKFYNDESLLEQMNEKKHRFYLIEQQKETIGFLSVSSENNADYFLHKFYIYNDKSSTGAGTEALTELIKLTSPKTLTLTVNRKNFKSINFYFKNGFKINSVEDFDIGNGYFMTDFVMQKIVKS